MTIDDCPHYDTEERKRIIASYAPHELEARTKGIGRIFPITEETITCEHRDFPSHFARIAGLDFG
jgi:hypothetical protein